MQEIWNVNYKSAVLLVQKALPYLMKQKGSGIVIIGSNEGYDLSFPLISVIMESAS